MSTDLARRERFERVASEVHEPLQRFLRRRASADDAADVLADTLLVAWRRLDELPDEPLPWCYGVARRCLANHRRAGQRRLRLVQRAMSRSGRERGTDPQEAIEASDPELSAALEALSVSEAEIVRLWAWEQLEPREIAIVLGMTANAVSVALARSKRKLAARLDHQDPQFRQDLEDHQDRQDRPPAGHIQGACTDDREGDER